MRLDSGVAAWVVTLDDDVLNSWQKHYLERRANDA